MPPTQAFCPAGTTIAFASGWTGTGPITYDKTIGEVASVKKSGQKMGTDNATHLNSPNNYEEFIATVKSGGDVEVDYNFVPGDAGQVALSDVFEAGDVVPFKIEIGAAAEFGTLTFLGLVQEFGNYVFETTKKASDSCKLKISGKPVYTPAS
jgi:hypothetical protein